MRARAVFIVFTIRIGKGFAFLDAEIPVGSNRDKWMPCRFGARDPASGEVFLEEIARWLGVEVPTSERMKVKTMVHFGLGKIALIGANDMRAEISIALLDRDLPENEALAQLFMPRDLALRPTDRRDGENLVRLLRGAFSDRSS